MTDRWMGKRQADFGDRLVYRTSSRTTRTTHRKHVSKKKNEREKGKEGGREREREEFLLFSSYIYTQHKTWGCGNHTFHSLS